MRSYSNLFVKKLFFELFFYLQRFNGEDQVSNAEEKNAEEPSTLAENEIKSLLSILLFKTY